MQGERRGIERTQRDGGAGTNGRNKTGRERRRGKAPYRGKGIATEGQRRKRPNDGDRHGHLIPLPQRDPLPKPSAGQVPRGAQPAESCNSTHAQPVRSERKKNERTRSSDSDEPSKTREKGDVRTTPLRYDEVACPLASGPADTCAATKSARAIQGEVKSPANGRGRLRYAGDGRRLKR